MMKAVIDRFEAEFAVLILEEAERRLNVPRKLLPKHVKEGQWLQVEILGDQVLNVTLDDQETELARQRIADKLAALRRGDHLK
jgi:hypothetical protein